MFEVSWHFDYYTYNLMLPDKCINFCDCDILCYDKGTEEHLNLS